MRILFSPIGDADPLTARGDGPMLHIVRNYQPDKVVLFLSSGMAQRENRDSRNKHAIELLSDEMGIKVPEITYEYSDRTENHHYDFYIEEFARLLTQLDTENPDAEIIINVSSGTPAMEQALVAFDAFDRLGLRAVQVTTPPQDAKYSGDAEGNCEDDFETLWNSNPDKGGARKNRCIEVESAHFDDLLLRDNICALVNDYDYAAAAYLAGQSKTFPTAAKKLLDGCVARMELDDVKAEELFKGTNFAYDSEKRLQEYLWVLEVYLQRRQWADYLRAITPALFETFHAFVRDVIKLPDDAWLKSIVNKNTNFVEYKLDAEKIHGNERLSKIFGKSIQDNAYVSNGNFARIIENYASEGVGSDSERSRRDSDELNDKRSGGHSDECIAGRSGKYTDERVKLLLDLRKLEEGARHPLAHTTCRAEKESLEKAGGMTLEDSMAALFRLNNVKNGLYKNINEAIINLL